MTCTHVLGLIDAGPLAGYPPAHLAAAWRHAGTCPECGRALAIARRLTQRLVDWPDAAPPDNLAAVVMARIAQLEEARAVDAAASPARARGMAAHWAAWSTAFGGLTACAALVWSTVNGGAALVRVAGPSLGGVTTSGVAWPATLPEGLLLAASLALYLVGLFGPVAGAPMASGSAASR
jgi:hypothetical protein